YQRPDCNQGPSAPVMIVEEVLSDSVELVFVNDTLRVSQGTWPAYQWFRDGVEISGGSGPEYVPTQSGFYECQLTTSAGCTYLLGLQVEIVGTVLPASVAAFSLAPNPTSDFLLLRLELRRSERITISLTDVQQRNVFSQSYQGQRLERQIDLRFLPAGSYYLTVQLENGVLGRRVVKN
ncbi:MAG: T9SS type A sorting domain-containing protein, partial [Thermoanaerobaculia bacterium]|nr:T9SS type A sorting domain-containing protein [Thermoanaerobaculia bacterium]